jgi:hypothetical protein
VRLRRLISNSLMSVSLAMGLIPVPLLSIGGVTFIASLAVNQAPAIADTTTCSESFGTWRCTGPNGTMTCSESFGTLRCSGAGGSTTCSQSFGTWRCSGSSGTTTCSESFGTIRCNGPDGTTICSESFGTMRCSGPGGTTLCSESFGSYRCTGPGGSVLPIPSIIKSSPTPTPKASSLFSPTPTPTYTWGSSDPVVTKQICTSSKGISENCSDHPSWIYEACVNSSSGTLQQKTGNTWKNLWTIKTEKNAASCDNEFPNLLSISATSENAKGTLYFRVKFNKTSKVNAWTLNFQAKVVNT